MDAGNAAMAEPREAIANMLERASEFGPRLLVLAGQIGCRAAMWQEAAASAAR